VNVTVPVGTGGSEPPLRLQTLTSGRANDWYAGGGDAAKILVDESAFSTVWSRVSLELANEGDAGKVAVMAYVPMPRGSGAGSACATADGWPAHGPLAGDVVDTSAAESDSAPVKLTTPVGVVAAHTSAVTLTGSPYGDGFWFDEITVVVGAGVVARAGVAAVTTGRTQPNNSAVVSRRDVRMLRPYGRNRKPS
jgi:hypothetical protein